MLLSSTILKKLHRWQSCKLHKNIPVKVNIWFTLPPCGKSFFLISIHLIYKVLPVLPTSVTMRIGAVILFQKPIGMPLGDWPGIPTYRQRILHGNGYSSLYQKYV